MPSIKLPYGKGFLTAEIPDERLLSVLEPEGFPEAPEDQRELIRRALESPIESPRLSELAGGKKNIVIIASDHTRPVPSKLIMPLLLEEIRKGSPDAEVTILVATGAHRSPAEDELIEKFGEDIYANERIIVHDCDDKANLVYLGKLPSGGELWINRLAAEAELLAAEGFIEPHFFAGFSGGRKSVLPGVAGYESIMENHCASFIADKNATAGRLKGNPVHMDMVYAADRAGLRFILNVMIDGGLNIIDAVAGDPGLAHAEGCERLRASASAERVTAPVVITSNGGYPLDQNLYQLVKCMDTAAKCCEEGGVIICAGECRDGVGGEAFYEDFAGCRDPRELTSRFLSRKPGETTPDQWQSQILARILEKHRVIVVAPLIEAAVKDMGLGWAGSLADAMRMADEMAGRPAGDECGIVVIPNGPGVIVA